MMTKTVGIQRSLTGCVQPEHCFGRDHVQTRTAFEDWKMFAVEEAGAQKALRQMRYG